MNIAQGFTDQGSCNPDDNLIAGEYPRISRKITLLAGTNYKLGSVLGQITASGKYTLSASAATDGSQTPDAILAEDADASSADQQAIAYFSGLFNEKKLTLGTGHTIASITQGLRGKNIYLKSNQEV